MATTKKIRRSKSETKNVRSKSNTKSDNNVINQRLFYELTHLMGLGSERATKLINEGLTNIQQLSMKKWLDKLPEETKLFIRLKPIDKIPHKDVKIYVEPVIRSLSLGRGIKLEFVGSYRRNRLILSDIDIMLVSNKKDAINIFIAALKKSIDTTYVYAHGPDKASIILDLSKKIGHRGLIYKIDVFRTTVDESMPMLLYSTGSKNFNIRMRAIAKKKGYVLNQRGLYKNNKLISNLKSEKDYFDILNMSYLTPEQREM